MRIVGVTGGVDTHADVRVAAAVDHNGGLLGVESFPADEDGFGERSICREKPSFRPVRFG